jgi:hypothetical protein
MRYTADLQLKVKSTTITEMPNYDSDSSGGEDGTYTETNTLLGYSSKEPTDDPTNQLGGHPVPIPHQYDKVSGLISST